jgi:protein-disulfide isomerase
MTLESNRSLQGHVSRLKAFLDIIASLLVIAAAGAALVGFLWQRPQRDTAVEARRPSEIPLPDAAQRIDGAPTLGSRSARVALIEYADFQCQYCAMFAQGPLATIKRDYIDTGKVLMVFRHLPLPSHPDANAAAMATSCAAEQGRFWEMHDMLFSRHTELNVLTVDPLRHMGGLESSRFQDCMNNRAPANVRSDLESAAAIGVAGTPAFILGILANDGTVKAATLVMGAQSAERLSSMLDPLLRQADRNERSWWAWLRTSYR